MNITDIQNKPVQVNNYQTTFLTLKVDDQLFRFDLIDKKEFNLKKGTQGHLNIFEIHPLLIDYNENFLTTYINSKPDHLDNYLADFENAINKITKGCRNWTNYLLDRDIFLNNVKSGTGKLLEAPISITQKVVEICNKHNVATKTFGDELKRNNYKLIFIADNYVIAKEFRQHSN